MNLAWARGQAIGHALNHTAGALNPRDVGLCHVPAVWLRKS